MIIGVWGCGYIGLTTAVAFAEKGIRVICYDTNPKVIETINKGNVLQQNLEQWMGVPFKHLVDEGLILATGNYLDLLDCEIVYQFICVPTEENGLPTNRCVDEVFKLLNVTSHEKTVIIESTLVPGTAKNIETEHLVVVAPRRDFFESPEKNIKTLPRVFAGRNKEAIERGREILSVVCDKLIEAPDVTSAELVKCVENSLLYLPIIYTMQLARAYPNIDIRRVLQLAATHWRIPLYYPSIGTGGYCIPTSPFYVSRGAPKSDFLTLLRDAVDWEGSHTFSIAYRLSKYQRVAVLGICYKPDLKVCKGSPALKILEGLRRLDSEMPLVHDPYYTPKEIEKLGYPSIGFPEGLRTATAVLVATAHKRYVRVRIEELLACLPRCQYILDNTGAWEKHREAFKERKIDYHIVGDANWFGQDI